MAYTLFEKIITFTTILTITILSLHAFGFFNLELINIFDNLSGLSGISKYPVIGMGMVGAVFMLAGIFIAAAIGGKGKIGNVSKDRSNMQSVIVAYGTIWAFIIVLIIIG
ncbi:hypothetical protein LCGC14_0194430 [marine sediment metagenome]|uniref:Uncharacterized protein n=1 Tax=marine sediment metagenome TaxID=412755 RepID=A0A0F9X447_9ZZZZ|nr:hypothetical protein [bacterium]